MALRIMSQIAKRKMTAVIGTHSGTFHCDEALAIYMLRKTSQFRDADIVRSRDAAVLDPCDAVVDVGGIYDPTKLRFDHHQRGFAETLSEKYATKLSSAGLVYKHFGREAIACELEWDASDPRIDILHEKLYKEFIEALDATDNGIARYPESVAPRYLESTTLSARVARLNPWWNEPDHDLDERFQRAVALTGSEFRDRVRFYALAWLPARDLVVKALEERTAVDPSGKILRFEQPCPWKDHLFGLEEELGLTLETRPTYVLFPDTRAGQWRVQAVPESPESFASRKALPETWRGIRDEELDTVSGIQGCVFAHHSGFIGGNKTFEGALAMAQKALKV